jgi:hypothetical protein
MLDHEQISYAKSVCNYRWRHESRSHRHPPIWHAAGVICRGSSTAGNMRELEAD